MLTGCQGEALLSRGGPAPQGPQCVLIARAEVPRVKLSSRLTDSRPHRTHQMATVTGRQWEPVSPSGDTGRPLYFPPRVGGCCMA